MVSVMFCAPAIAHFQMVYTPEIALAKGKKKAIILEAEARSQEKKILYDMVKKFGRLGKDLEILKAIENSPLASTLAVQKVEGLPKGLDIFKSPKKKS